MGHPIIHFMVAALIAGCASPQRQEFASVSGYARLSVEEAIMSDGYRLPLRRWGADERPRALVLALHGFNDYSNAFATLGPYLATQSVLTFAYDQRGFGTTTQRGLWGGKKRLTADLKTLTELLRERYPAPPCYCSGRAWAARWSWSPRHRRIRERTASSLWRRQSGPGTP